METSFDKLEKTVMDLAAALKEAQDLAKKTLGQRDELAEALREVLRDRITQTNLHHMPPAMRSRLEKARAALAKLEAPPEK